MLSRVDGNTSVEMIAQLTGLSLTDVASAVVRLLDAGLVEVPGVSGGAAAGSGSSASTGGESPRDADWGNQPTVMTKTRDVSPSPRAQAKSSSSESMQVRFERGRTPTDTGDLSNVSDELIPTNWPTSFEAFDVDPELAADVELVSEDQQKLVHYYYEHLRDITYYDLFQVPRDANRRAIRKAYFRRSKAFHPDRWFRKELGEFSARLESVFKWLNRGYSVLTTPDKRRVYDKLLDRGMLGEWELEERQRAQKKGKSTSQSVKDNQRRTQDILIARGRKAEGEGDWKSALQAYRKAVSLRSTADLRLRLARCTLKAEADLAEARTHLDEAKRLGAGESACLLLEAQIAEAEGDTTSAGALFQKLVELEPSNAEAIAGLRRLATAGL